MIVELFFQKTGPNEEEEELQYIRIWLICGFISEDQLKRWNSSIIQIQIDWIILNILWPNEWQDPRFPR